MNSLDSEAQNGLLNDLPSDQKMTELYAKLNHIFFEESDETMYGKVLDLVLEVMESKYGIFGYLDNNGDFVAKSMTMHVWDQCEMPKEQKSILFPRNQWGGLWGKVLKEQTAVYSNGEHVVPEGHIHMERSLGVPIISKGVLIGLLHVANKTEDYTDEDRDELIKIARRIAPVLHARLQRDDAKMELAMSEQRHIDLLRNVPDIIFELGIFKNDLSEIDRKKVETWVKQIKTMDEVDFEKQLPFIATQMGPFIEGSVLFANHAVVSVLGYPEDQVLDKKMGDFLCLGQEEKVLFNIVRILRAGELKNIEYDLKAMDEREVPVSINMAMMNGNFPFSYQGVIRDISQQKAVAEQMERANIDEAVGKVAAGIAHDFNNLLSIIMLNGQMAESNLQEMILKIQSFEESMESGGVKKASVNNIIGDVRSQFEEVLKVLEEINEAGVKSSHLTQHLLAFSRQQVLKEFVVDVNNVVVSILNKLIRRVLGEHIDLNIRPCLEQIHLKIDAVQLERAVVNLAINARDAMPKGGSLTISTKSINLTAKDANRYVGLSEGLHVMISVVDTGSGIPKEIQTKIFEPYFSTKPRDKGNGLGLAMVYGFVKQSGGDIVVESVEGKGTTFKILLPAVVEKLDPISERLVKKVIPRGTETVLIVEDDAMLRKITSRMLTRLGYKVIVAENGMEAQDVINDKKGEIDLVLTDAVMPKGSGPALLLKLKTDYPDLPVILTSGYPDGTLEEHGVDIKNVDFIPKPISHNELGFMVRGVLDKRKK